MPDIFNGKIENVKVGDQYIAQIKSLYKETPESQTVETTLGEMPAIMYTDYNIDNYITIDQVQVTACGEFSKYQVGDIITDTRYPLNAGDCINVTGILKNTNLSKLYASAYNIDYTCEYQKTVSTDFGVRAYYNFPFPLITNIHNYVENVTAKVTLNKKAPLDGECIVQITDFKIGISPTNFEQTFLTIKSSTDLPELATITTGGGMIYYGFTGDTICQNPLMYIESTDQYSGVTPYYTYTPSNGYIVCLSGLPAAITYQYGTPVLHHFKKDINGQDKGDESSVLQGIKDYYGDNPGNHAMYGTCCQVFVIGQGEGEGAFRCTSYWYIWTGPSSIYLFATEEVNEYISDPWMPIPGQYVRSINFLPVVRSQINETIVKDGHTYYKKAQEFNVYYKGGEASLDIGFIQNNTTLPSGTKYHYSIDYHTIANLNEGESKTVTLTWNGL